MKKFTTLITILIFVLVPALTFAQDQQTQQSDQQAQSTEQQTQQSDQQGQSTQQQSGQQSKSLGSGGETQPKVAGAYITLKNLANKAILNNAGEQIGMIQDAFLTSGGQISFVIANLQNAPGVTQGTYVVPVSMFTIDQNNVQLNVPVNPQFQQLAGAKNAGVVAADSIQASKLLQFSLVDGQGNNLGNIQDVVLNLQTGEVSYVAVDFSGVLGSGDKLFAVPFTDIWYNLNNQTVTLYNVNQQALQNKPGFSQDNWPETADPNWNKAQ